MAAIRSPAPAEIPLSRAEIAVARERPGMDNFATLLPDRTQGNQFALRRKAHLLDKLANRGLLKAFMDFHLALGNAPVAVILVFEQRPAGMRQKQLRQTGDNSDVRVPLPRSAASIMCATCVSLFRVAQK